MNQPYTKLETLAEEQQTTLNGLDYFYNQLLIKQAENEQLLRTVAQLEEENNRRKWYLTNLLMYLDWREKGKIRMHDFVQFASVKLRSYRQNYAPSESREIPTSKAEPTATV